MIDVVDVVDDVAVEVVTDVVVDVVAVVDVVPIETYLWDLQFIF